eukprot:g36137.t1
MADNDEEEVGLKELACRWEWEADDGSWNVYSAEHEQELSEALRSRNTSVQLSLPSEVTLRVDLKKMVQKNSQTGFERSVRYAVKEKEDYFVWQWQGDDTAWHPYSAALCAELEQARRQGQRTVDQSVGRVRYQLDVGRMRQVNSKTKYERKMSRLQSDAADPAIPSGGPQPSDGASCSAMGSVATKRARREHPEEEDGGVRQAGGDSQ